MAVQPLPPLSQEQLRHFTREGYVICRGALDPDLCRQARELLWLHNESTTLSRADPDTWVGPFPASDASQQRPTGAPKEQRLTQLRQAYLWNVRSAGGDELLHELLPRRVFPWLEQLLGEGEVVEPVAGSTRGQNIWGGYELRGMYTVLRQPTGTARIPLRDQHGRSDLREAHVDFQPVHCTVTAYIDDVEPQGGGTALYPRTHRLLHEADNRFTDLAGAQVLSPPTPDGVIRTELKPELKHIFDPISRAVRNMELGGLPDPVEFTGRAGDVCIWHTRLFHRSCYNYSDRLRMAIFYDVAKKDTDARAYGASLRQSQLEHFNPDGMEGSLQAMEAYVEQRGGYPVAAAASGYSSLWADWSDAVRDASATAGTGAAAGTSKL